MTFTESESPSLLADSVTKRLRQLGISRREFERRSGLSRQTLYKIEKLGETDLREQTYRVLDEYLKWVPGTAVGLAQGVIKAVDEADALTLADRESAYRWRIVERIQSMSLQDLETVVAIMETKLLGQTDGTGKHLVLMEKRITSLEKKGL